MGAGRRADGGNQGYIGPGGEEGRRQPVRRFARVHAGCQRLPENRRQGQEGSGRARLSPERPCAIPDHRQEPHDRSDGRLSRELLLSGGAGKALQRAAGQGLSRPDLHGASRPPATSTRCSTRSSTIRSTASSWPRWRFRPNLAKRCQEAGVPVVLFNRNQDDDRLSAVTSDNVAGGRKIADFLIAGGHRAHRLHRGVGRVLRPSATARPGFENRPRGRTVLELHAREVGRFPLRAGAQAATRRMFDRKAELPDAVFVANDHMAFAVMDVLRAELGLRCSRGCLRRRLRRRAARRLAGLRSHHRASAREPDGHGNGQNPARQYRAPERRTAPHRHRRTADRARLGTQTKGLE